MTKTYTVKKVRELPNEPGIYRFISAEGNLLYIGKATSLRSRVSSYFIRPLDDRLQKMISLASHVRITTTQTAIEALILEANSIRCYKPKYNVLGKDDRSFVEIAITDEDFPKVIIVRPTQKLKVKIKKTFGPYTSSFQARLALKIISRIFKFHCKGKAFSGRPCLYKHIGICPGLCTGEITKTQYNQTIKKIISFLEGKKTQIIKNIKVAMSRAAKKENFETATRLRNELFALQHIKESTLQFREPISLLEGFLPTRLEAYDVSNLGGNWAVASMVVLINGQIDTNEYRRFKIRLKGQNDPAMIREVLERRLSRVDWALPDFILVDGGKTQLSSALKALKITKKNIPIAGVIKGINRKDARLQLSDQAMHWLQKKRLTTRMFEPIARLARDEAHRFAISYHRKLKRKSLKA